LAVPVAEAIGAIPPSGAGSQSSKSSPALSQENTVKSPRTRKVGVIVGTGFDGAEAKSVLNALIAEGVQAEFISDKLGVLHGSENTECEVVYTFLTADSVLFDAVYALGGELAS